MHQEACMVEAAQALLSHSKRRWIPGLPNPNRSPRRVWWAWWRELCLVWRRPGHQTWWQRCLTPWVNRCQECQVWLKQVLKVWCLIEWACSLLKVVYQRHQCLVWPKQEPNLWARWPSSTKLMQQCLPKSVLHSLCRHRHGRWGYNQVLLQEVFLVGAAVVN